MNANPSNKLRARIVFSAMLCATILSAQSPGSVDLSFWAEDKGFGYGDGTNEPALVAIEQADGKILLGGAFNSYDRVARIGLCRLHPNGDLDTAFVADLNGTCRDIALQPDGRILITGSFSEVNGQTAKAVARLWPDGSVDGTFDVGDGLFYNTFAESGLGNTIALQPDGKIWVGGYFTHVDQMDRECLVRLDADGSVDTTVDIGAGFTGYQSRHVKEVLLQPDGKVLVAGYFNAYDSVAAGWMVRLMPDGTRDSTFQITSGFQLAPPYSSSDPNGVSDIDLFPDGSIAAVGEFNRYNGSFQQRVCVLTPDGLPDPGYSFGTGFHSAPAAVLALADGRVVVDGGHYSQNVFIAYISRFLQNGSIDQTFSCKERGNGHLSLLDGQRILTVRRSVCCGRMYHEGVAVLQADGSLDDGFAPGTGATDLVDALHGLPDGRIMLGGNFGYVQSTWMPRMARLFADGTIDPTWSTDPGLTYGPYGLAVRPDGRVVSETYIAGDDEFYINQFLPTGERDTSFHCPITDLVTDVLVLQPDGKLLVGGSIAPVYQARYHGIERFNLDGSPDPTFIPLLGTKDTEEPLDSLSSYRVNTIAVQADERILLGGRFRMFDGIPAYGIVRLLSDGTADPDFNSGMGFAEPTWLPDSVSVYAIEDIAIRPDGRIVVVGNFMWYDGVPVDGIVQLLPDGSIDPSFSVQTYAGTHPLTVALDPNGRCIVGLRTDVWGGSEQSHLVRLLADGTLDQSFDTGAGVVASGPDPIRDIAVTSDGAILMCGEFVAVNGIGRNRLAKIHNWDISTATSTITTTEELVAYPIPTYGQLWLRDVPVRAVIIVTDIHGRMVFSSPYEGVLDLGGLVAGSYVVTIAGEPRRVRVIKM